MSCGPFFDFVSLDDNGFLSLVSGEQLFGKNVKIVFETSDLTDSSPATISRCSVVYFSKPRELSLFEYFDQQSKILIPPSMKTLLLESFSIFKYESALIFKNSNYNSHVSNSLRYFSLLVGNFFTENLEDFQNTDGSVFENSSIITDEKEILRILQGFLAMSLIYGFLGFVKERSKIEKFIIIIKKLKVNIPPIDRLGKNVFSYCFCKAKDGNLYDWRPWSAEFIGLKHQYMLDYFHSQATLAKRNCFILAMPDTGVSFIERRWKIRKFDRSFKNFVQISRSSKSGENNRYLINDLNLGNTSDADLIRNLYIHERYYTEKSENDLLQSDRQLVQNIHNAHFTTSVKYTGEISKRLLSCALVIPMMIETKISDLVKTVFQPQIEAYFNGILSNSAKHYPRVLLWILIDVIAKYEIKVPLKNAVKVMENLLKIKKEDDLLSHFILDLDQHVGQIISNTNSQKDHEVYNFILKTIYKELRVKDVENISREALFNRKHDFSKIHAELAEELPDSVVIYRKFVEHVMAIVSAFIYCFGSNLKLKSVFLERSKIFKFDNFLN